LPGSVIRALISFIYFSRLAIIIKTWLNQPPPASREALDTPKTGEYYSKQTPETTAEDFLLHQRSMLNVSTDILI